MNNENNVQNQNNNSVNNNIEPTIEMFDFGNPVNNQNNSLFEVPSAPMQENIQNVANPINQTSQTENILLTPPSIPSNEPQLPNGNNTQQANEMFEIPTSPVQEEIVLNENANAQQNGIQEVIPTSPQMEVLETTQEIVMPNMQTEQVVLDNEKKKQSSDLIVIVLVIIMIIGVFYIDNIISFVQNNILQTSPSGVTDASSDNLYEGYIKINDQESGITLDKLVRFYNFQKDNDNFTIIFNYKTLKDVKNITEKGYYIELYDVEKKVLYKGLLTKDEKHTQNSTYTYDILLDSNVFEDVTYAQIKKYDESELNKESELKCIYKVSNAGYNELYKHNFKFKNDTLISYDVDKYIELIDINNASAKKAKLIIQDEYDKLNILGLPAIYENDKLVYSINLEEVTSSYIPLYKKGTTSQVIKKREEYLKWECE